MPWIFFFSLLNVESFFLSAFKAGMKFGNAHLVQAFRGKHVLQQNSEG
jgi:hypothetical protein